MRHTIVCVALNHFVLTLPNSANKETTAVIRAKVFQHRGAAIKALSGYVADEKMRYSELTLACILMFMTMEVSFLPSFSGKLPPCASRDGVVIACSRPASS